MVDWDDYIAFFEQVDNSPVLSKILKTLQVTDVSSSLISLTCENLGMKIFLDSKKEYLEKLLKEFSKKNISISFVVGKGTTKRTPRAAGGGGNGAKKVDNTPSFEEFQQTRQTTFERSHIQQRFTFENFAVSNTNHIAHAAAKAVADNPGISYNPLFLHGDVGVGKTHLSHAIANTMMTADPRKKLLYSTSEDFTNALVDSIRRKDTNSFRTIYRHLDLLIIDDVQFIAGKTYVQEEFYHTFNSLVGRGCQIILTSDRHPREIKELEDRLRSRFSGGLIIDVQKPDFELRTAILLIKAQERSIPIDIEAAKHIAEKIKDTRALEGELLKLMSVSLLGGGVANISMETAQSELKKRSEEIVKKTSPQHVVSSVSSYFSLKTSEIKGPSRKERIARARQIIMYLLRKNLSLKYEEIAFFLKRKDHTTVMHGVEKIKQMAVKDPVFRQELENIEEIAF